MIIRFLKRVNYAMTIWELAKYRTEDELWEEQKLFLKNIIKFPIYIISALW